MKSYLKSGMAIPQIDGKDVMLSGGNYTLIKSDGSINTRRFKATMDCSLDLLKLEDIYRKVYRNSGFSFRVGRRSYGTQVMSLTFKYSVKTFNRRNRKEYVKAGYGEVVYDDCISISNGDIVGVKVGEPVQNPRELPSGFSYHDGCYHCDGEIPTIYTTAQIREMLYEDGFWCDGIHYVRWKRSAGSARTGKCLFINEKLLPRMRKWERCGVKVVEGDEIDLAAFESYVAQTSSSIIDTIELYPENILVVDDYISVFYDDVMRVYDEDGELLVSEENARVENSIFDGESLLDMSDYEEYKDKGMLLLRSRFFKSCCFNCNIQDWFRDNGITDVSQLNGFTLATDISQIKLITTPSSIKYLKFDSLDKWLELLEPDFGVVKYEKPTHFFDGQLVQTHYQLINSIQLTEDEVEKLLEPTYEFIHLIQNEPYALMHWLKCTENDDLYDTPAFTKSDIVYKMMFVTPEFAKTKLYNDFKLDYIRSFVKNLKCGHVLVEGNYSTLCGNPIEMLLHSIGRFDGKGIMKPGTVHSTRFVDGSTILGSRSPHITASNVLLFDNVHYEEIDKYMNLTDEIIVVNSINENIMQRAAGCDFDSDSILITNNQILIDATKRNYHNFKVATYEVSAKKITRYYTAQQLSDLDIKTSKNLIGDIVNLSQELNSIMWHRLNNGASFEDINDIYKEICKLSILSNIEIDRAKREFDVDTSKILKEIRTKYQDDDGLQTKPFFFAHISRQKGYYDPIRKKYIKHDTAMDYLVHSINKFRRRRDNSVRHAELLPFSAIIDSDGFDYGRVYDRQVSSILGAVDEMNQTIKAIYADDDLTSQEKYVETQYIREDFNDYIAKLKINTHTMTALLKSIDKEEHKQYKRLIFYGLFGGANESFYDLLKENSVDIPFLIECDEGNIQIFNKMFQWSSEKTA